jgi:hypothetical protein
MIERVIKLRSRIDLFCTENALELHGSMAKKAYMTASEREHLLSDDILGSDDWQTLIKVMDILKKFYELTKYTEGTKLSSDRGVLSDYITIMNELIKHVRSIRDDIRVRSEDPLLVTPALEHLKTYSINCWT